MKTIQQVREEEQIQDYLDESYDRRKEDIALTKRDYIEMTYQFIGSCIAGSLLALQYHFYGLMVLFIGVCILVVRRKYDLFLIEDLEVEK